MIIVIKMTKKIVNIVIRAFNRMVLRMEMGMEMVMVMGRKLSFKMT